jgi:hypothetical protein
MLLLLRCSRSEQENDYGFRILCPLFMLLTGINQEDPPHRRRMTGADKGADSDPREKGSSEGSSWGSSSGSRSEGWPLPGAHLLWVAERNP